MTTKGVGFAGSQVKAAAKAARSASNQHVYKLKWGAVIAARSPVSRSAAVVFGRRG